QVQESSATEIKSNPSKRRRWVAAAFVLGIWTLPALLYATQSYLGEIDSDPDTRLSWWRLAAWQLIIYYVWAAFTPLIIYLGRRFPVEQLNRARNLAAHIFFGSLVSLTHIASYTLATRAFKIYPYWRITGFKDQFTHFTGMYFHLDFLTYVAILGVGFAIDYYRKYRQRELQTSELRAQLARAQLETLRAQLHPHFLFNTLNSIVGLIRNNENRAAIRMTTGLSELLRHALDSRDRQEVALSDEMEFIHRYLAIQQMRFSDRLQIEIDIAQDAMEARVPSLILQPLVENAVRHGIAARDASGLLKLSAARSNGRLEINLYNDGPQLPLDWRMEQSHGIGLANTRARLHQLYGQNCRLDLRNHETGVMAKIAIPFQPAERNGHEQKKNPRDDSR
ncbi:MAG TPA: histidine kinase, partial [Blastocatellia bacterium]